MRKITEDLSKYEDLLDQYERDLIKHYGPEIISVMDMPLDELGRKLESEGADLTDDDLYDNTDDSDDPPDHPGSAALRNTLKPYDWSLYWSLCG